MRAAERRTLSLTLAWGQMWDDSNAEIEAKSLPYG
jgi:hypothetical protein